MINKNLTPFIIMLCCFVSFFFEPAFCATPTPSESLETLQLTLETRHVILENLIHLQSEIQSSFKGFPSEEIFEKLTENAESMSYDELKQMKSDISGINVSQTNVQELKKTLDLLLKR